MTLPATWRRQVGCLPEATITTAVYKLPAHRLADGKNGQLVTFELEADAKRFEERFVAS